MDRIGSYILENELGRGAFGVVYRGHHEDRPDTPVAIKLVESRGNVDRLMLEPALLSKLDHPCIVHLNDYFLDNDRLVLVLEFVKGEDLKTCVERGDTFEPAHVRDLLIQIASALEHAHGNDIVHRDIKLSNILVDRSEARVRFVLTDFGIGQKSEGIQTRKRTGGTYFFMAPEQLRGRPGPQSDLWALGVVAYRLLTGHMPFEARALDELSSQILFGTPPPLSKFSQTPINADLESAVFHLLEKSLNERTASAKELLKELGHSGTVDSLLAATKTEKTRSTHFSDKEVAVKIRRYRLIMILCFLGWIFQGGIFQSVLGLPGIILFYQAHQRSPWPRPKRIWAIAVSLALWSIVLTISTLNKEITLQSMLWWLDSQFGARSGLPVDPAAAEAAKSIMSQILSIVILVVSSLMGFSKIIIMALGAYLFAKVRRLQRTQAMRRAILESVGDPEGYLKALRDFVDYRFEDVGFQLKYAEALIAHGRLAEAAVEAKLALLQDPYNFSANLLLANTYYSLGLRDDCLAVCNQYLVVAGYCFEFSELKQQCERKLEVVT